MAAIFLQWVFSTAQLWRKLVCYGVRPTWQEECPTLLPEWMLTNNSPYISRCINLFVYLVTYFIIDIKDFNSSGCIQV